MASAHQRDPPPARHSPVAALASLEYLQTQRRGSITDPSLHTANNALKFNSPYRHPPDQHPSASASSSTTHTSAPKHYLSDPRPSSPYVFGDATAHPVEPSSQLRKILHSPSLDHPPHRTPASLSHDSQEPSRVHSGLNVTKEPNQMNVDNDRHSFLSRRGIRDPPSFDPNMRRHSIAVGQNSITLPNLASTLHGTKRKMSFDRGGFAPLGEDIDPQLVGPGVPSNMDVDADAPAPKRRGSTIDTQRIAQLSLNDRRNSVDSRGSSWILNDRRESAPSLFSNVPGINSFNTGPPESQNGRAPSSMASFSWATNTQSNDSLASSAGSSELSHTGRQFDPVHQMNLVPPMNYPPDRRMSVPDTLTHPSSSRNLRSQSRPPSRQNTDPNSQSGPSSGQEEHSGPSSPNAGKSGKEPGMTPYSRSPELRVSHKLAERKRRKEMKDLFDELRDQLPADRGMKASKWEILSKAIDFVAHLKRSHQEMAQELEMLRAQLHGQRPPDGMSAFPPGSSLPHSGYGQAPPTVMGSFQPSIPPSHIQSHQTSSSQPDSRPNSTQSMYPPSQHPSSQQNQNGNGHRADAHPT
ncbi:hypothetical protein BDN70DRAFT_871385 [Pholiota conissans]|uniref:BHLH domain-containing protein n=1 Tax=Pholiota conissans TaxID=109636 RepID=A0A9P5ZDB4_9AGAR|nr:hypothetical protein BDN70DRAFT_871385 [Pholiota conissans]